MTAASRKGRACTAMLLAGAFAALAGCSSESEPLAVAGSAKAAKLTQCVEPTEFMRRNHMELIKHQRDATVHLGIRATKHSLAGCVDCHVQKDADGNAVPVNARDQFCAGCHEFTGAQLDCFQCHSTVPNGPQPASVAGVEAPEGPDLGHALAQAAPGDGRFLRAAQQEGGR